MSMIRAYRLLNKYFPAPFFCSTVHFVARDVTLKFVSQKNSEQGRREPDYQCSSRSRSNALTTLLYRYEWLSLQLMKLACTLTARLLYREANLNMRV